MTVMTTVEGGRHGRSAPSEEGRRRLSTEPTAVLVHGACCETSSWSAVIRELEQAGCRAIAIANPLRGVASDAAYVAAMVRAVDGPVILVGHSYGGTVISQAASDAENVHALVYVAGYAPEVGESSVELIGRFPGSMLPATLAAPVTAEDGSSELTIDPDHFHEYFAPDLAPDEARHLAMMQRSVSEKAIIEPSSSAAWKDIPSWWIYGAKDRIMPPGLLRFMAARADARETVEVPDASHMLLISRPEAVASQIVAAARSIAADLAADQPDNTEDHT